jgi:hypothetical protein
MSEATAALAGDNGGTAGGAAGAAGTAGAPTAWNAGFDEDTNAYVTNKGWQNPSDILNSYRNLEKFAGGSKNLIELPGEGADQAALDAFFGKLGRPDSADKYDLKMPDGADKDLADWFKQNAHKAGLNGKQAASLFDAWNEMSGARLQAMQQQAQADSERAIAELKREWGQGYDGQIDAGKRAVAALGYNAEQLDAIESKLGTADMLKLFAAVGSKMGEPSFEGGERSGTTFGLTPASAKQQIADLKMDKGFMGEYLNGNPDAVSKMKRLMEFAHGA